MSDDEKEFFLMLHGWRIQMNGKRKAYFHPSSVVGTYDLNDAYHAAQESLNGRLINFMNIDYAA